MTKASNEGRASSTDYQIVAKEGRGAGQAKSTRAAA
jgi:hypothetical protein